MATKSKPRTTKKAQLIRMLSTKAGADVEVISGKLGWQHHTTRAAISGLKTAGFGISTEKQPGKPTRYRIRAKPEEEQDTGARAVTADASISPAPENADAG